MGLDVVGIGALNADFVATRSIQASLDREALGELTRGFRHASERQATLGEVLRVIENPKLSHALDERLGGSAFNTIRMISTVRPKMRLGVVGVVGDARSESTNFERWFSKNKSIDRPFVRRVKGEIQGICISGIQQGDRKLATFEGANKHFSVVFGRVFRELVSYLKQSRYIHLTSFFDKRTQTFLVRLLEQVKRESPSTALSIDPGEPWTSKPTRSVLRLLGLADLIFFNEDEFAKLGHKVFGEEDLTVAIRISRKIAPRAQLIVLKRYETTAVSTI